MKTAYELAMERLNKTSPTVQLTAEQKRQLAELDSQFAAKIAELEISLQAEITKAGSAGETEKVEQLRQQLTNERKALEARLADKKEQVRQGKP